MTFNFTTASGIQGAPADKVASNMHGNEPQEAKYWRWGYCAAEYIESDPKDLNISWGTHASNQVAVLRSLVLHT